MISSALVFLIASAYAMSPVIDGALDPASNAADVARLLGPAMAGVALFSAFPSAARIRHLNTVFGVALLLSPIAEWSWPATALVIQVVTGAWVTGLSLLPRKRDRIVTGGGWRHVFSSPTAVDRIETAAGI